MSITGLLIAVAGGTASLHGGKSAPHPDIPANFFTITNNWGAPFTFYVGRGKPVPLTKQVSLPSGAVGMQQCGASTCYVRYSWHGGYVEHAVAIQRRYAYSGRTGLTP